MLAAGSRVLRQPHRLPDLSLRGRFAPVAISGRQLRFRRKCPIIRPSTARFPRRFAPRNDTSGERAVHQCTCAVELPSARCSGNAATDAIGSYRFIARLFVSPVRRRERHAAPLQFSIEIRKKIPEAQASGSFSNTINHNQSQSIIYFAKTFFRRAKRGRPSS